MNHEPPSPFPDDKRLAAIEKLLDSASNPKKGSRGYRDMRWLVDQLHKHHAFIAGLTHAPTCVICRADLPSEWDQAKLKESLAVRIGFGELTD